MRHAELVKRIAYHLAGRLPPSVEVDDLIQAGMLGLLEAASNYAPNRGASFETYAGIRIRGAMIDALRKLDWAPRSVHRKARAAAAVVREIEQQHRARCARYRRSPSAWGAARGVPRHRAGRGELPPGERSTIRRPRRPQGAADPFRETADEGFRARWRRRSTGCRSARGW